MDGNGRWGWKIKKSKCWHKAGLKTVEKIIKISIKKKIRYLTLYTFSTENWKRPPSEIKYLFDLLENFLINKIDLLIKNQIKLKVIGNRKGFSKKLSNLLNISEKKIKKNNKLQINLALNYGSKFEIIHTIKSLNKKKLEINENNINMNLYTANIPDPDILIRTGNTNRLSNFLLWQIAYTEIFFVKKLWPDFDENDFSKIILKFKKLKRNFGNV